MFKHLWTKSIVGMVGLTLLLTPAISEAQRGGGGGRGGSGGGRSASSGGNRGGNSNNGRGYNNNGNRGYYNDGGRGYYGGYGGLGIGLGFGFPGFGYGVGSNYYNEGSLYSGYPRYSFYPNETNDSYYQATVPHQLKNPNDTGFVVRVPDANAEVWFQDYKTQQRGMVRHFESDPLDPNSTYTYTLRARWTENGQSMDQTRQINAKAGQNQLVDFTTPVSDQVPALPQASR